MKKKEVLIIFVLAVLVTGGSWFLPGKIAVTDVPSVIRGHGFPYDFFYNREDPIYYLTYFFIDFLFWLPILVLWWMVAKLIKRFSFRSKKEPIVPPLAPSQRISSWAGKKLLIITLLLGWLLIATIVIFGGFSLRRSPLFLPEDGANIQQAKRLICNLTARGFSDWVFIESAKGIPYQKGDYRNPKDFTLWIQPPKMEKLEDRSVVLLYTWNKNGGLLTKWETTVKDGEVTFLRGEVIQTSVGHHDPLPVEGRFLPTPGSLLVNEKVSTLEVEDKPACRQY